jgi:hypothetical protein
MMKWVLVAALIGAVAVAGADILTLKYMIKF